MYIPVVLTQPDLSWHERYYYEQNKVLTLQIKWSYLFNNKYTICAMSELKTNRYCALSADKNIWRYRRGDCCGLGPWNNYYLAFIGEHASKTK